MRIRVHAIKRQLRCFMRIPLAVLLSWDDNLFPLKRTDPYHEARRDS